MRGYSKKGCLSFAGERERKLPPQTRRSPARAPLACSPDRVGRLGERPRGEKTPVTCVLRARALFVRCLAHSVRGHAQLTAASAYTRPRPTSAHGRPGWPGPRARRHHAHHVSLSCPPDATTRPRSLFPPRANILTDHKRSRQWSSCRTHHAASAHALARTLGSSGARVYACPSTTVYSHLRLCQPEGV